MLFIMYDIPIHDVCDAATQAKDITVGFAVNRFTKVLIPKVFSKAPRKQYVIYIMNYVN